MQHRNRSQQQRWTIGPSGHQMMPRSRMPAYVPQQPQQGIKRKLDATMPAGETTADMVPRADNNPMDVGTVRKKLDNYEYRTALDFADDIRLIFSNCFKYKQQSQSTSHHISCRLCMMPPPNFRNMFGAPQMIRDAVPNGIPVPRP